MTRPRHKDRPHHRLPHLAHPMHVSASSDLDDLVRCSFLGAPSILPIVGPSRAGKTYLIERAIEKLEPTQLSHLRETRILHVVVPAVKSIPGFLAAILEALGLAHLAKAPAPILEQRVRLQLGLAGTRVLVLDEIHHLGEFKETKARRTAADIVKVLHDTLQISIVMVGLPRALELFDHNEQLAARSGAALMVLPYHWGRSIEREYFERCIATLCNVIEEQGGVISIDYDRLVRGCYFATAGRVAMLDKLFTPLLPILKDGELLTAERLHRVYEKNFPRGGALFNPFDGDGVVDDLILIRCHHDVLARAGIEIPLETNADLAALAPAV